MKLTIWTKLLAGFSLLLAVVVVIGVYSVITNENALEEAVG